MELIWPLVMIAAGFYVGWNIGANDAANCIGTTVGAQIVSYRTAVLIMSVFVILGGVLQGQQVMKTVGKGIVISDQASWQEQHGVKAGSDFQSFFPDNRLPDKAILVALLSAGLFVSLATFSRVPVSTSQAIVGGIAGTGLGIVGLQADYFKWSVLLQIFSAWVVSPLLTLILAFGLYSLISLLLKKANVMYWSKFLAVGVVISAAYVSFSLGANDVGNAIGPLLSRFPEHGGQLALLGGVSMAVGAWTFGARVTDTVGKSITPLDYGGALSAQFAAAFAVHVFSMLGIPVSTSQAVVGGVIGVGLTKGMRAVSLGRIRRIFLGWILTPTCAALFAAILYRLLP
ncbi:MAG: inorganic phosphate transporter [Xanthomonadales bacterium]|nr:inorganic phosphate transporter [Xanthomonadales bacterium]